MATYLNEGNINFSAATWQAVDTTSLKTDGTSAVNVTTANLDSTAFTPGAITVDGICLLMASRVASPTGTLTITLRNSTAGTNVTSVTVNVSDLPALLSADATTPGIPVFFKFSASQLLLAATNYVVRLTAGTTNQVAFYATAANNWNRLLRTTTTGTLGAGDVTYVVGNYLSAGSNNTYTVTMDNNSTTAFGACNGGSKGILRYSVAGNTQLRLAGNLTPWAGFELDLGTVASPVPDGTTAILEFASTSNAEFGIVQRPLSTIIAQGFNKGFSQSLLAADAASSATSLTVADSVGSAWKNGDNIILPSTTRTASQLEKKALTAGGSGTTLTITALTNAHSGTAPTQAKLGNVTRNVKIRASGAFSTYLFFNGTADIDWIEIIDIGSATAARRGIDTGTSANLNVSIRDCGIHNTATFASSIGWNLPATNAAATVVCANNVFYNQVIPLTTAAGNGTTTFDNNLFYGGTTTSTLAIGGMTFTNNIFANNTATVVTMSSTNSGTNSGNAIHGGAGIGLSLDPGGSLTTLGSLKIWRNGGVGFQPASSSAYTGLTVNSLTAFGNLTANVEFQGVSATGNIVFNTPVLDSDASFTTAAGFRMSGANLSTTFKVYNGSLGVTSAHTTADITFNSANCFAEIYLFNTTLASTVEVNQQTNISPVGFIRSSRHDGVAGAYKSWFRYGTIENDTSVFNTAAPSEKLTPNDGTFKLRSAYKTVALNSGQTATVSVFVRKTVAGANQPRLVVLRNDSAGISSDVVLATMTAGVNSWEQISGTTSAVTENVVLTFYIESDSGNGIIYDDDWLAVAA